MSPGDSNISCHDINLFPAEHNLAGGGPLQLRKAELVDYDGVRAAKNEVLELLYACFRKDRKRRRRFAQWHAASPRALRDYALYEALREELGSGGWQSWPGQYQVRSSSAVRKFAAKKRERVEFYAYLQWNARQQLDLVQRRARTGEPSRPCR